jgi:hypothetical protein
MCDEGLLRRVEQLEVRRRELDVLIAAIKTYLERDDSACDAHRMMMDLVNVVPAAGTIVQCRWPGRIRSSSRRRRPCTEGTSSNDDTGRLTGEDSWSYTKRIEDLR